MRSFLMVYFSCCSSQRDLIHISRATSLDTLKHYLTILTAGGYAKIGKDEPGNEILLAGAFEAAVPMDKERTKEIAHELAKKTFRGKLSAHWWLPLDEIGYVSEFAHTGNDLNGESIPDGLPRPV